MLDTIQRGNMGPHDTSEMQQPVSVPNRPMHLGRLNLHFCFYEIWMEQQLL